MDDLPAHSNGTKHSLFLVTGLNTLNIVLLELYREPIVCPIQSCCWSFTEFVTSPKARDTRSASRQLSGDPTVKLKPVYGLDSPPGHGTYVIPFLHSHVTYCHTIVFDVRTRKTEECKMCCLLASDTKPARNRAEHR